VFDPEAHFDSLKLRLVGCETWAEVSGPIGHIAPDGYGKWSWCTWRFEARFVDGSKFIAQESYSSRRGGQLLRKLKYRLEDGDGNLVVQLDTHGSPSSFDDAPHLHLPNRKDRVYEGDWMLKGHTLSDYDFHKMWILVEKYINGERLPWQ
jgi:hypothetical protein